jgi:hypothetical protein
MRKLTSVATATVLLGLSGAASALSFNFSFVAGTSLAAEQAFAMAGQRWSSLFSDAVTLDMTVGTASLGSNILAATYSNEQSYGYGSVYSALTADRSSASDSTAVASLSSSGSFGMLINRTSDNPNGSGSATPYLVNNGSANNTKLVLTTANAKALGLATAAPSKVGVCASNCDASIEFSNAFAFDYNPVDGITAGYYDFVGIATHEIGHALGFISGVDLLDTNSRSPNFFAADQFLASPLDLFRYSAASTPLHVIDVTARTTGKYFSIDGGATVGPSFATGKVHGDGNQASHWKYNQGLGIMDPVVPTGTVMAIGTNDVQALDVIGWDVTAVPEAPSFALFGVGIVGLALRRRGARQG